MSAKWMKPVNLTSKSGLTATPLVSENEPLPDREVSWNTSAPSGATVDDNAVVMGVTPGTDTITGSIGGHYGTAQIEVLAPVREVLPEVGG